MNTNYCQYSDEEIRQAVRVILDVFSGADGGVKFSHFYHGLLPSIIENKNQDTNFVRAVETIVLFSKMVNYDHKPQL